MNHDLFTGAELRNQGMATAAAHAEIVLTGWNERAHEALERFIYMQTGSFMAEEVREYAERWCGLPKPPDNRAWGSVMMRAARAGLIKQIGYGKRKDKVCHVAVAAVWEKTGKKVEG